jgi:DMSO/TMAO reductase YedYZ molybdopterin-dependent catalytic subunit
VTLTSFRRGALAGAIAGLATVAAMYLASGLTGVRPLPDLLQQPILAIMPGPVFGFLIDNLQHAGKVIEEAGLIVAMVVALAALGGAAAILRERTSLPRVGLIAGAAGWAVVALVVLPLAGAGLLGLNDGGVTPLTWALVFALYALVWELASGRDESGEADPGRRRLLRLLPVGIGLGALALVGIVKVPDWVRAVAAPPEAGLTGPVPELTPVQNFYRVSKNFQDPVVPVNGWALKVTGKVGRGLRLAYQDLAALPSTTQTMTLCCISNDVGGDLISTGTFTGVPLRDLMTMAQPGDGAAAVNFKARDGYTESLPLATVMATPEILVAYQLDGARLPDSHGFPARVLIPGRYGMKGAKWLDEIEVAASSGGGFWEAQGWDEQAVVRTSSRFDSPKEGAVIRQATIPLAGVAFAGTRGIQVVEWSADGGRTWEQADVKPPLSPLSWVLWRASWTPSGEGVHTLVVRARDGAGQLQSNEVAASYPSGAAGFHTVHVTVGR